MSSAEASIIVLLIVAVSVPGILGVAILFALSRYRSAAGPLPGQRWAIANGPTVEVLSIDAAGEHVTCRFPDGREEPIPAAHLKWSGRLLRADAAIPEIADARRER